MKRFAIIACCLLAACTDREESLLVRTVESELQRCPTAADLDGQQGRLKWNYTTGLELKAFLDCSDEKGLQHTLAYVEDWYDAIIDSTGVVEIVSDNELNTQQKVAAIKMMYDKYNPKSNYVDNTGGYGKGAIDLATEKNISLNGVNFAQKPFAEEYPNLRVEAFLELARDIKRGFWVPNDVKDELLVFQSYIDNKGRIALIDKQDIKKALGRSPDRADAIALANYARNHGGATVGQGYSAQQAQSVGDRYLQFFLANN
jgi:hypothetical protein